MCISPLCPQTLVTDCVICSDDGWVVVHSQCWCARSWDAVPSTYMSPNCLIVQVSFLFYCRDCPGFHDFCLLCCFPWNSWSSLGGNGTKFGGNPINTNLFLRPGICSQISCFFSLIQAILFSKAWIFKLYPCAVLKQRKIIPVFKVLHFMCSWD